MLCCRQIQKATPITTPKILDLCLSHSNYSMTQQTDKKLFIHENIVKGCQHRLSPPKSLRNLTRGLSPLHGTTGLESIKCSLRKSINIADSAHANSDPVFQGC